MCHEAFDYSLAVLKLIPDWFVTSKIIKKYSTALYPDKNIVYFDEGSDYALFDCKGMDILKGNMQFIQKVTFEPLMDFKQNHYGSWKYYKSCYF